MPAKVMYRLVGNEDEQTLTLILPDDPNPKVLPGDHPQFERVLDLARDPDADPDEIARLADASQAVSEKLTPLSERVAVADGHIYFDGEAVESVLTQHILRFLHLGVDDWKPLVAFMENLANNPVPHSQHRLYGWLQAEGDFTITDDGCIIAYKGVNRDARGTLRSVYSGPGIVNGQRVNGQLDNSVGNTIEVERSYVEHNPGVGCSTGLHAGTFEYARQWGNVQVAVKVNPRDVVSVPTDSGDAKVRVCRYQVLHVAHEKYASPVVSEAEYGGLGD